MPIKRNIWLLYAMALLQGMVFYYPIATLYRQAAGVTLLQMTTIESISLVLSIALELPWGLVAERIGYRKSMIACCVLYFVSKLVFWRAENFWEFLGERVILAVTASGLSGVDQSMLYLSVDGDGQREFGILGSCSTAGALLANVSYSLFIGENYRLAGLLTAISYGLAMLLAFGLREVRPPEREQGSFSIFRMELRRTLRDGRLLLFLAAFGLLESAVSMVVTFLGQLQYLRCGLPVRAIGVICTATTLAELTGGLSDRATKRIGAKRLAVSVFLLAIAACAALALTGSAAMSIAAIMALVLAMYLFRPLGMRWENEQVRTKNRAMALGVNAVFYDLISCGSQMLFGWVADTTLPGAMALGGAFCAAGFLALLLWMRMARLSEGTF